MARASRRIQLAVQIAVVAITALVVAAGVRAWALPAYGTDQAPSVVVFPEQRLPLTFSHASHLTSAGLECADCHDKAATSRSAVDGLIPGEDACTACHAIDRAKPEKTVEASAPPARCGACHPGFQAGQPVARVYIPPPNLKFDHSVHVGRGVACTTCHGDLAAEGVGLATRAQLPPMRLCLTCHDGKQAPDACTTCHLSDVGGVVRTDFAEGDLAPSGVLRGDAHDLDFRTNHDQLARTSGDYCASCHKQSFCSDCHVGVVKPMDFHAGDYVIYHAVEARRGSPDCSACHRQQSFCAGCHERSGVGGRATDFDQTVTSEEEAAGVAPRLFHPAGWEGFAHARQARRNLDQCASCHREDFCIECHGTSTRDARGEVLDRANPHPPGWAGSRRCKALAARSGRMCQRCHVSATQVGCDWTE